MKSTIILWGLLLILGWLANDVYSSSYEKPISFVSRELISPADRIKDSQILIYNDRVVIKMDDVYFAKYTDTNSMDPVLDEDAIGLEIKPEDEYDIQVGDVVSYRATWTDGLVAHRVVDIGMDEDGWYAITKGDNVAYADPGKVRFDQIEFVLVGVLY